MASTNDYRFTIFISHKVKRDREAAEKLRAILPRPCGFQGLDVHISEEIPHAQHWREWITKSLGNSDMLLLLFTDQTMEWDWCLYEAGLFTDLKMISDAVAEASNGDNVRKKNVVYICPPGKPKPAPLEHLNGIEGTPEEIKRFLTNLYTTNIYGCDPPLVGKIDPVFLEQLTSEVSAALNFSARETERYGIHLDLVISDPSTLSKDGIPASSRVFGNLDAYRLFGKTEGNWTWGDVENWASRSPDRKWIGELAEELSKAYAKNLISPIQSTFRPEDPRPRGGKRTFTHEYLPCLEEVERRPDKSMRFSIFFSEQPTWEDERAKTKSIMSFDRLIDELKDLIVGTPSSGIVKMLSFTPALGFLAIRDRWVELEKCIGAHMGKVKITCLDEESLKKWHSLFDGRKDSEGRPINEFLAAEATKAAEGLLARIPKADKVRRSWEDLPEFYAFSSRERAIVVTPLFLPRLNDKREMTADRGALPNVEMVGLVTSQKEIVDKVWELQEHYSENGGSNDGAARAASAGNF